MPSRWTDRNPSPEMVEKLRRHYQDEVWAAARIKRAEVDKLVDGTFANDLWKDLPDLAQAPRTRFVPPFGRNIMRHLMNQMAAYEPRIHREPVTGAEDARAEADAVEDGLSAALRMVAMGAPLPVFKQMARYLFQYDYMAGKCYLSVFKKDPPLRKEFGSEEKYKRAEQRWEAERANWNPLRLDIPHPDQVLMDPFEKTPPFAIHVYTTPAWKVKETSIAKLSAFDDGGKMLEGEPFQMPSNEFQDIEVVEFWSEEWHKVFYGATQLYAERNLWGFNAWFQAFGGQGFEGAGDRGAKPDMLADPLLLHLKDPIIMRTQQMNARHEILLRAAYALMAMDTNQVDTEGIRQALAEGGILPVAPDRVGYLGVPNLPNHLMQEDAVLDRVIQEGSQAAIGSGFNAPNVDTVGQTALLQERSDNVSNDVRAQTESAIGIIAGYFMRLTDVLDDMDMVPKGGLRYAKHRLDPRQFHGDYNVSGELETVDPVLLFQERELARNEVAAGLMSRSRYFKVARVENVTEEEEEIILDRIRQTEPYASYYAELVLQKRERISLQEFMEKMAAKVQAEQDGGGGPLSDALVNSGIGMRPGVQGQGGVQGAAAQATRQLREPLGSMNGVFAGAGGTPKPPARER